MASRQPVPANHITPTTLLAWSLGALAALLAAISVWLYALPKPAGAPPDGPAWAVAPGLLFLLSTTGVGALIAWRRPRTPIGWLFLATAIVTGLTQFIAPELTLLLWTGPGLTISWIANAVWVVGLSTLLAALAYFPDGRLPSPRWQVIPAALAVGSVPVIADQLFGTDAVVPPLATVNTHAIPEIATFLSTAQVVGAAFMLGALGGIVVLIVVRLRRAEGIVRRQLLWFSSAAVLFMATLLVGFFINAWWLFGFAEILVPIGVAVAIFRHGMLDIDLLINRAAVYGSVTAVLASAFVAANIGLQYVVESVTGQRSELITGILGVGVGLGFGPLHRLIRPAVDRLLPSRVVLVLMFTDLVESTQAIVEMGDERWRRLLGQYLAAVRRELSHFGGHEINTAGDAFFATFERPISGLRCAWAVRASVRKLGLESRTGLHLGECEVRGEQVSGLAVNTAARVMASAGPGEILLSDAMRDAVQQEEVVVLDRGSHQLKGVPGEWHLFAVEPTGTAG